MASHVLLEDLKTPTIYLRREDGDFFDLVFNPNGYLEVEPMMLKDDVNPLMNLKLNKLKPV